MNDTFDYIMRFVVIVFGYCCALLAASWFLTAILFRPIGYDMMVDGAGMIVHDMDPNNLLASTSYWSGVLFGGIIVAMAGGSISFLPAAILVLLAEIRGYRSSLFYAICGGILGLAAAGSLHVFEDIKELAEISGWAVTACAGIIGGFVYWLIAGRNAGRLVNRPAA